MIAAGRRCESLLVQPGQQHRRLGLAVTLAHARPEDLNPLLQLVRRDGRPCKEEQPQTRIVEILYARMREHTVEGSWRQKQMCYTEPLDIDQDFERVKARHYHVGRAKRKHRKRDNSRGMRKRRGTEAYRLSVTGAPVMTGHF